MHLLQIDKILVAEQKKNEYRPGVGTQVVFDRPTIACQFVCGLLEAMHVSAMDNIKQPNLQRFLEEVREQVLHPTECIS